MNFDGVDIQYCNSCRLNHVKGMCKLFSSRTYGNNNRRVVS